MEVPLEPGLVRLITALLLAVFISYRSLRKKTLSPDGMAFWVRSVAHIVAGAALAFFVGFVTIAAGWRLGAVLLVFFYSSSRLTRLRSDLKKKWTERLAASGVQRDLGDYRSTVVYAVETRKKNGDERLDMIYVGPQDAPLDFSENWTASFLLAAFLGHYATCCGDTWASELGILNPVDPRLVPSMRRVPRGTNGAVSPLGTLAALLGGVAIGLTFYIGGRYTTTTSPTTAAQWPVIILGAWAGLFGAMVDSFLGAFLQYSGYCIDCHKVLNEPEGHNAKHRVSHVSGVALLSNNQVNWISSGIGALGTACVASYTFR